MRENEYQAKLVKKLNRLFPGCYVMKLDTDYQQGIPDLLILFNDMWAILEVKAYGGAPQQPNQDYFIQKFNDMSFGAFIYPENEDEVLNDLQSAFGLTGSALSSQR